MKSIALITSTLGNGILSRILKCLSSLTKYFALQAIAQSTNLLLYIRTHSGRPDSQLFLVILPFVIRNFLWIYLKWKRAIHLCQEQFSNQLIFRIVRCSLMRFQYPFHIIVCPVFFIPNFISQPCNLIR